MPWVSEVYILLAELPLRPVVPGVSEVYYLQSFRLSPALSVWTFSLAPMAPSTVPRPGRAYSTTRNKVES